MNLFETEEFEERIRAVENRAGRVAWEVLVLAQGFALAIYVWISGKEISLPVYILPLYASYIAAYIVRKRSGVNAAQLREERLRLGRTKTARKIFFRQFLFAIILLLLIVVISSREELNSAMLWILLIILMGFFLQWRLSYGRFPLNTSKQEVPS